MSVGTAQVNCSIAVRPVKQFLRRPAVRLLRFAFFLFGIFLSARGAYGAGKEFDAVKGYWVCKANCTCAPASPLRSASITEDGTARNECGAESKLKISNLRLQAAGWSPNGDLGGTISADGKIINWDNHSVWEKFPGDAAELETRRAYWERKIFYCGAVAGQPFPSKNGTGEDCDDGDSVMFNALICRGGDPRGCEAVKHSQDGSMEDDGRFWRSPNKLKLHPPEAFNGQTTFSGDHALGLFLYFGYTRDSASFKRWISWIDKNERCDAQDCGLSPSGTPRYCKDDRCALRLDDCPTLLLLAERLNAGVPFCSPNPIVPVPSVVTVAENLKTQYDHTLALFPAQPPELRALRDNFDRALKTYQDATALAEQVRAKVFAGLIRHSNMVQVEKALTLRISKRGFSRHNAMVQIMMLQDWGLGTRRMSQLAKDVADEHTPIFNDGEPKNPFFQYVAHRRDNKGKMLSDFLEECPAEKTDPNGKRSQWSWERETKEKAWLNTMYWDCLFIASMYVDNTATPPDDNTTEDGLRKLLNEALEKIKQPREAAEKALKAVVNFKMPPSPPTIGDV